jgi:hypothetical protein
VVNVLPFVLIEPVPTIVGAKSVNVPPLLNVNEFKFNEVDGTVNAVVPKFNVLNQLPAVNVPILVPLPVNDKLGALVVEPSVVPNVNVLVTDIAVVKPPVPVQVNPVAVAIDNTVVDSKLEALKQKIVEIAKQQPYWGEQIPTRWFLLEQQLMRLRDAGVKVFI